MNSSSRAIRACPQMDMAETAPATAKAMPWWWSRDDERFHGPCSSRADAIMDAWSDDPDRGAYICQAQQREWAFNFMDADWLAEQFDEANYELSDPDGDGPSHVLDKPAWERLAQSVGRLLRQAYREQGSVSWGFVHQAPSQWVEIGAMWAAVERAEADATAPATSQQPQASSGNRKDGEDQS